VSVRIVAGAYRGRRLVTPAGDDVRPTKDVVREALFSALDARGVLVDSSVLDLFAGSGALALEAMSRGAAHATMVERDREARRAIAQNIDALGVAETVRVVTTDVGRFLAGPPPPAAPFDVVFADPPYDTAEADVDAVVAALEAPGWLAPGAALFLERPGRRPPVLGTAWQTGWQRRFGDTLATLSFR
jgi:16S rRNA (guanine966-N2)-methyltransferase